MLESYGTGTGVAIGAAAITLPAAVTFMAFFAGDARDAPKVFLAGEALGLAAALACIHYSGGVGKGTVGRGILYGLAVPFVVMGIFATNDKLNELSPTYKKLIGNVL